ncbi:hypothetical protein DL765_001467 [Monosporascus sp. GIB2]|nr:hypothetical protein DL765_001467 [Monosporascus sp. GIB2]
MASPVASAALKARVQRPSLLKKLCRPEDLLHHFPNGVYVGWSGFTGVGYPKCIVMNPSPRKGTAALDMIERQSLYQVGKAIAKGINEGRIKFFDKHLSTFPVDLVYGFYTKDRPNRNIDMVVVEASEIKPDGSIVPGASVGATPELVIQYNI